MERPLSLFEGYGVEIEYVLVDRESLDVLPAADRALQSAAGAWVGDHDDGPIGWSNELVLHLLELKTNGPVPSLDGVAGAFQESLARLRALLGPLGGRLMPTGMHPWMEPRREARLWPHDYAEIYATYDRLFDCRRHGWANVQSTHLNLSFAGDEEFGRLLAAVRLLLPILPGLAASSPVVEGRRSELLDARLDFYRTNSTRVPSMAGAVIPEPVYRIEEYHRAVLAPIHEELAALDTDGYLVGNEWVNARGAIARFDRSAIEVRLLDVQECPRADLAIAAAVADAARAVVEERWSGLEAQQAWPGDGLVRQLAASVARGPRAEVADPAYAAALGQPGARTVGELWRGLVEASFRGAAEHEPALDVVLTRGTLAERIVEALGTEPSRARLVEVYRELCDCLDEGRLFEPRGAPGAP